MTTVDYAVTIDRDNYTFQAQGVAGGYIPIPAVDLLAQYAHIFGLNGTVTLRVDWDARTVEVVND